MMQPRHQARPVAGRPFSRHRPSLRVHAGYHRYGWIASAECPSALQKGTNSDSLHIKLYFFKLFGAQWFPQNVSASNPCLCGGKIWQGTLRMDSFNLGEA